MYPNKFIIKKYFVTNLTVFILYYTITIFYINLIKV